jgi:hypothetical protein
MTGMQNLLIFNWPPNARPTVRLAGCHAVSLPIPPRLALSSKMHTLTSASQLPVWRP